MAVTVVVVMAVMMAVTVVPVCVTCRHREGSRGASAVGVALGACVGNQNGGCDSRRALAAR